MRLESYIDHTLLKPTATDSQIKKLCEEAKQYGFYAVCVNGCFARLAKQTLETSGVKLAIVVGFPLGAMSTATKCFEAEEGVLNGADEIDMVLNIGFLKAKMYAQVADEIKKVKAVVGDRVLKVILETCYLTSEEIQKACEIAIEADADFVKTSTGFGTGGATFEAVELMKKVVGNRIKIKASGGIKDRSTAIRFIEKGASRLGTSSGISLVKK